MSCSLSSKTSSSNTNNSFDSKDLVEKKNKTTTETPGSSERKFDDLITHEDEIKNDPVKSEHFAVMCPILFQYLNDVDLVSNVGLLLKIFGRVSVNCFSISSTDMIPIGVGLYLNLSKIDHSCKPNAVVVFDGAMAFLNTFEPLQETDLENIRVCYCEMPAISTDRNRYLSDNYFFTCTCEYCSSPQLLDSALQSATCAAPNCVGPEVGQSTCNCENSNEIDFDFLMQKARWQADKADKAMKNLDEAEALNIVEAAVTECGYNLLVRNVHMIRLNQLGFDACISLQKWEEAMVYGMCTVEGLSFYRDTLLKNDPSIVVYQTKLGKLMIYLDKLTEGCRLLDNALECAKVVFSESHTYYDVIRELLIQCRDGTIVND